MYGGNFLRIRGYKAKRVSISGSAVNVRDEGYQYVIVKNTGSGDVFIVDSDTATEGFALGAGESVEFFFGNDAPLYVYAGTGQVDVLEYEVDTVG